MLLSISIILETIVYFCNYFPRSRDFSLMSADYRVYAHISRQSRGVVASACAFLAYMGAHQVENIYKDEDILTWSHQHSAKFGSWCSRLYSNTSNMTLITQHNQ